MMLPTDAELVDAAAQTYTRTDPCAAGPISVFQTLRDDGLRIIAIEGTHDAIGWCVDFFALKATDQEGFNHPALGFIHAGFYASAQLVLPLVAPLVVQPYAICGHSLGGAMALLLAGMLIDRGHAPVKTGAFAPPKVGGDKFVETVTSYPFCSYRYGQDVVPLVPFSLPDFPYRQVPTIELDAPHELDVFKYHSIGNYVTGVHAYKKPSAGHWWEWWEKKL